MSSHELSTVAYDKAMNTQLMTEHEVVRSQAIATEVVPNESSNKPDIVASRAHGYPKHSQKESHPLAAGNGKEIISNEVEPTTEMIMSKEKPPLDPGCSSNSEIGAAILRQPIHRLQDETQVTSISLVEVQAPVQLFIPTTSSNRFERLEIVGGNLVVDLDYAATSCDHNHGEAKISCALKLFVDKNAQFMCTVQVHSLFNAVVGLSPLFSSFFSRVLMTFICCFNWFPSAAFYFGVCCPWSTAWSPLQPTIVARHCSRLSCFTALEFCLDCCMFALL
ncbi:unnamed protein product [Ilex paraguariensis]|uniref:Uncharacterized protein n=1 Tax=Ilex paraguariensis TaxID=185542 RepID=A0ABC8TDR1_9AQUA